MSGTVPAEESRVNPDLIETLLRRRKSTAVLYWRYKRPGRRVYASAIARLVAYRIAAAGAAIIAFALASFDGAVARAIGYPHSPPLNEISWAMITTAVAQSILSISHLAPVIVAFGLALVVIPLPHRWLFGITLLCAIGLGYYQSILPPFPWSELSSEIDGRIASVTRWMLSHPSSVSGLTPIAGLTVIAGYLFYRSWYTVTARTIGFIPHRPRSYAPSTFVAVSVSRRIAAAALTAGLLMLISWLVESMRVLLPQVRYATPPHWHIQLSLANWVLIAVAASLIVCVPRPNGHGRLLIILVAVVTIFAFWPQNLLPPPPGFPVASYNIWLLVIVYFPVTGVAFDLVSALLDWRL